MQITTMTDLHDQRAPQDRYRRSIWATFICWALIVFFAYGMPALGYQREENNVAKWIAAAGVIWVPVTIWFSRRKMQRELRAEERQGHD